MFPNKQKRINEKDSIMEKAITLSFLIKRTLMPCLPVVCHMTYKMENDGLLKNMRVLQSSPFTDQGSVVDISLT